MSKCKETVELPDGTEWKCVLDAPHPGVAHENSDGEAWPNADALIVEEPAPNGRDWIGNA